MKTKPKKSAKRDRDRGRLEIVRVYTRDDGRLEVNVLAEWPQHDPEGEMPRKLAQAIGDAVMKVFGRQSDIPVRVSKLEEVRPC